jgi:hypothetical protein
VARIPRNENVDVLALLRTDFFVGDKNDTEDENKKNVFALFSKFLMNKKSFRLRVQRSKLLLFSGGQWKSE